MVRHLNKDIEISNTQDPFQYKQGSSTEDEVFTLVHLLFKHLDKPKRFARVLFLDFSSLFNTIQPDVLLSKMIQSQFKPRSLVQFISYKQNTASKSK